MLIKALSSAHIDVLESASIALVMRSKHPLEIAAGWELKNGLFAKWESEGLSVGQIFDRVLIDNELVTNSDVAGKIGSLSDDILRVYCRVKQRGDYTYIGAMEKKFGGRTGLGKQAYAALQSPPDRARAVKLIDTWLGLLVSREKSPHGAFKIALQDKLKTSLLDSQLFEDELLPLLYKYVVLYNMFKLRDEKMTLSMELSLLHGATTVDERLETRVQNWLELEPKKKSRNYVLEQVFQDWKVYGEPGSKLGEKWYMLEKQYAEFLQHTQPKA
ncbi:unnamed protein product [Hyaloperonospora brassicae]|uniref:RxLR effector candidate protein n=1 Tax=Hyaloperonospora brassicae TaxID=162125 RepID=A0AAV0TWH2_HYABA|nr:unnamed protein product [Hyaloperonospora brassicae]